MPLKIVPLYAGFLAIMFMLLTIRTIRARQKYKVAIGLGHDETFTRTVRVHGNFSEYTPFILLMLAMLEVQGAWPVLLHGCGVVLIVSRISHAFGVSKVKENIAFRIAGMVPTMFLLLLTGGMNIYFSLGR